MLDTAQVTSPSESLQPKFCSGCGGNLSDKGDFCAGCGSSCSPGANFCAKCGHDRSERGGFCPHCGAAIEGFAAGQKSVASLGTTVQSDSQTGASGGNHAAIFSCIAGVLGAIGASVTWVKLNSGLAALGSIASAKIKSNYSIFDFYSLPQTLASFTSSSSSSSSELDSLLVLSVFLVALWIGIVAATIVGVVSCAKGKLSTGAWAASTLMVIAAAVLCYSAMNVANDGVTLLTVTSAPIMSIICTFIAVIIPALANKKVQGD